jgi:hypothetical protein
MPAVPPDAAGLQEDAVQAADVGSANDAPDGTDSEPDARTGVPAADQAAERLRDLDDAPLDQHVEIYEDTHRRLEEGLADLDER